MPQFSYRLTGTSKSTRRVNQARLHLEFLEDRVVPTLLGNSVFPADNPWNQKITNAPVSAQSAAVMNSVISKYGNGRLHPDFGQDTNSDNPLYGIPYNAVHGNSQAKVNVVIDAYADESDVQPVPIPPNAVVEGDMQNGPTPGGVDVRGDSHLLVYDEDNNILYELYAASRPSENSDNRWHADQESVWNLNTNSFRTLGYTSADAAGLPILPGLARPDEALPVSQGGQGAITHALRMTLQNSVILNQFIYPASHIANPGNNNAAVQPPMGARFRLKASVDISQLDPQAKIVAQALKDYGLIVADNGSNFYITGASYSVNANNGEALTWNDDDVQDTLHGLKSLTFSQFELVDLTPVVTGLSTSSGSAGTTVTVTGQNFSGASGHLKVLFGSTAATLVSVIDDGHLTAVAPAGTGAVDVRVQSGVSDPGDTQNNKSPVFGYGTSAVTSADRFSYSTTQTGFTITGLSSSLIAGAPASFTVTALLGGSTNSAYVGVVHFTSTDGNAQLPADYAFTTTDKGTHTFTVTLKTASDQTITAADTTNSGLTVSAPVTVNPASASQLGLNIPMTAQARIALTAIVTIQDAFGNRVTGYRGTMKWTSTDSLAALPGSYTFTASDNGQHTFTATLGTAGTQSVTVADQAHTSFSSTATVAVSDPFQSFIVQAYQDLLGRAPDSTGLDHWMGVIAAGGPRSTIATQLTHSAEYYGTIITPAYQQFLGRSPDATGLAYWTTRMQQGLTDEQLQAGFIASPEFYLHAGNSDRAWVDALYQDLLGRAADPSGLSHWLGQLAAGASRASIALGFAASTEEEKIRIAADYQHYLRRAPTATEVDYWAAQFARGVANEDVVAGFVGSNEYFQRATSGNS